MMLGKHSTPELFPSPVLQCHYTPTRDALSNSLIPTNGSIFQMDRLRLGEVCCWGLCTVPNAAVLVTHAWDIPLSLKPNVPPL